MLVIPLARTPGTRHLSQPLPINAGFHLSAALSLDTRLWLHKAFPAAQVQTFMHPRAIMRIEEAGTVANLCLSQSNRSRISNFVQTSRRRTRAIARTFRSVHIAHQGKDQDLDALTLGTSRLRSRWRHPHPDFQVSGILQAPGMRAHTLAVDWH